MPLLKRSAPVAGLWAALWLVTAGCGPAPAPVAPKKPPPVAVQPPSEPSEGIDRGVLDYVLGEGPVWVLERVPVEPVVQSGKFVGWRVLEMPLAWSDVDLVPGDVVTAVNAMPVETPNDLWAAWTTLSVASELKIAYLRDEEPREVSLMIHGQPDPELAQRIRRQPPPSGKARLPYERDTIVIRPSPKLDSDVEY